MALALGVLGGVLAVEFAAWIPYGSAWLVGRTLSRLPEALDEPTRDRWSEEIEADSAVFADRPFAGLTFALRLRLRGARRLAATLAFAERLEEGSGEDVLSPAGVSVLGTVPQIIVVPGLTLSERAQREEELCRILGESHLRVVETFEEARRITEFYAARARREHEGNTHERYTADELGDAADPRRDARGPARRAVQPGPLRQLASPPARST